MGRLPRQKGQSAPHLDFPKISASSRVSVGTHPKHQPGSRGSTLEDVAQSNRWSIDVDPGRILELCPRGEAPRDASPPPISLQRRTPETSCDCRDYHA